MKYTKATQETIDMVNEISEKLGLDNYGVSFEPIYVKKAKEVCKVVKANDLVKYKALRLAMEQVSFDPEKEKLIIGCNSVVLPVGYCIDNEDAVKSALYNATIMAKIQHDKKEEEDKKKALRTKGKGKNKEQQ